MIHAVLHRGVPVGVADLSRGELASGRLERMPAYDDIAETVRAGSAVLLMQGFFGAAAVTEPDPSRERAVGAAAALAFELEDEEGRHVAADFVNLIEAPDGGVVVIARLRGALAGVSAANPRAAGGASDEARERD